MGIRWRGSEPPLSLPIECLCRADGTYGLQHTMQASSTARDNRDGTKPSQKATATSTAPAAAFAGSLFLLQQALPFLMLQKQ